MWNSPPMFPSVVRTCGYQLGALFQEAVEPLSGV